VSVEAALAAMREETVSITFEEIEGRALALAVGQYLDDHDDVSEAMRDALLAVSGKFAAAGMSKIEELIQRFGMGTAMKAADIYMADAVIPEEQQRARRG
jgi:hypothetical protein